MEMSSVQPGASAPPERNARSILAAPPTSEIIPKEGFYDYENKYQPGAAIEVCPAEIPAEWEKDIGDAALTVFKTIGLKQ